LLLAFRWRGNMWRKAGQILAHAFPFWWASSLRSIMYFQSSWFPFCAFLLASGASSSGTGTGTAPSRSLDKWLDSRLVTGLIAHVSFTPHAMVLRPLSRSKSPPPINLFSVFRRRLTIRHSAIPHVPWNFLLRAPQFAIDAVGSSSACSHFHLATILFTESAFDRVTSASGLGACWFSPAFPMCYSPKSRPALPGDDHSPVSPMKIVGLFPVFWRREPLPARSLLAASRLFIFIPCTPIGGRHSSYGQSLFRCSHSRFILGPCRFSIRAASLFRSRAAALATAFAFFLRRPHFWTTVSFPWGYHSSFPRALHSFFFFFFFSEMGPTNQFFGSSPTSSPPDLTRR